MIRFSIRSLALVFGLSLLAFVPAAFAVDGVTLINQATSTNGLPGCAHAGFPIAICKSGSYRLSGDLTIASVDTDAIDIRANDVTLDLNGFSIVGPVTCQPGTYPIVCSNRGQGIGVLAGDLYPGNNVTLRNGNIRGMGAGGVLLYGTGNLVDSVHVEWSGGGTGVGLAPGIFVLFGVVSHCSATANVGAGIAGITVNINFSTSSYNGAYGFQGSAQPGPGGPPAPGSIGGTVVSNSVASNNGQDGIFDAFLAVNNTSTYNIGLGLRYDGNGYGYTGNVIYGNSGGTVTALGTSLGHNLCNSVAC